MMMEQEDNGRCAVSAAPGQRPSGVEPVPVSSKAATPNAAAQATEGVCVLQSARGPIDIDASIAPVVEALNRAGVETIASCSGHGHRPGNIALRDGREIIIARNFAEARLIDSLFSIGASGEAIAGATTLRNLRESAGMKARDMASAIDITPEHLSRLECGRRPVSTAVMMAARFAAASAAGARSAETGTGSGPKDRQSGDAKQRDAQPSPPSHPRPLK